MTDPKPTPVTFVEPSYALLDVDQNAVLTTEHGNLAIFSTPGMAQAVAKTSKRNVRVVPVMISPGATPANEINPEAPVLQQARDYWQKALRHGRVEVRQASRHEAGADDANHRRRLQGIPGRER